MNPQWIVDGHFAWPLFAAFVYTIASFLIADFVWRGAQLPKAAFIGAALLAWLSGLALIACLGGTPANL